MYTDMSFNKMSVYLFITENMANFEDPTEFGSQPFIFD